MQNQRRRNVQPSPILIGLFIQLASQLEKSPYKPPVTIFLLFINIFVHLSPFPNFLGYDLSNIHQNCIHPAKIVTGFIHNKELLLNRLVLSSIIHVDDMHLYYNMLSLCWKGINLESTLGSAKFLQLVIFSLLTSHILMVFISTLLNSYGIDSAISGYQSCAVGFSAVLFSLKYVWNYHASTHGVDNATVMGFLTVPLRYAAWLELVLISLITPNVSFIGHLSGILAGVLYVHGTSYFIPTFVTNTFRALFGRGDGEHIDYNTPGDNNINRHQTYGRGTVGGGGSTAGVNSSNSNTNHTNFNNYTKTRQVPVQFDAAEIELEEDDDTVPPVVVDHRTAEEIQAESRRQRLRRFDM